MHGAIGGLPLCFGPDGGYLTYIQERGFTAGAGNIMKQTASGTYTYGQQSDCIRSLRD